MGNEKIMKETIRFIDMSLDGYIADRGLKKRKRK